MELIEGIRRGNGDLIKMDWKKLIDLLDGHEVYLQMHNFPDPDAVASAYGMQKFLMAHGVQSHICYDGRISSLAAKKMIEAFNIEVIFARNLVAMHYDDFIITIDGQKYNANFTDLIGDEVACIDHHPTFVECEYRYSDIRITGACASIVANYFYESETEIDEDTALALMFGIRVDTDCLTRGVTKLDIDMYGYLFQYTDADKLQAMSVNAIEIADLKAYAAAIKKMDIEEDISFVHIPFECGDSLIGMISDFMMSVNEVNTSVIYAERNGGYKLSVRTVSNDIHAGRLISEALSGIGSGGGHQKMAGGVIYPEMAEGLSNAIETIVKRRFTKIIHSGKCQVEQ